MKLLVGLGNPGKKYQRDRHNLGFMVIDKLADSYNITVNLKKFKALYGKGTIEGENVILCQPQTYMNLSGQAIVSLAGYYKIDYDDILVIVDDLNLSLGRIRIRKNGSDGGHNGLKSIIQCLATNNFPRIRLGIGLPEEHGGVSQHVLSRFHDNEQKELNHVLDRAKDAVVTIITDSVDKGMNLFNS